MDKVTFDHDRTGSTLTVWFDHPSRETICEEIEDDQLVGLQSAEGMISGARRGDRSRI